MSMTSDDSVRKTHVNSVQPFSSGTLKYELCGTGFS